MQQQSMDQDRINSIVKKYRPRLLKFISARLGHNKYDSEDIVQNVCMKLVTSCEIQNEEKAIVSWLYTVARNEIVDFRRKKKSISLSDIIVTKAGELSEDKGNETSVYQWDRIAFEESVLDMNSPEESFCQKELSDAVTNSIKDLPNELMQVFMLHEFEGKSFKDMAKETNTSINTLLSRKNYAKKHLQKKLKRQYEEFLKN